MVELSDFHFIMITTKKKVIDKKPYVNDFLAIKLNHCIKIAGP